MVAATSFQREEDEVQQSNSQKFLYYSIKNPLTFPTSLSCSKASTSKTHEKKIMLATSQVSKEPTETFYLQFMIHVVQFFPCYKKRICLGQAKWEVWKDFKFQK